MYVYVCVCMYVCVYVCMYVCVCMYVYVTLEKKERMIIIALILSPPTLTGFNIFLPSSAAAYQLDDMKNMTLSAQEAMQEMQNQGHHF